LLSSNRENAKEGGDKMKRQFKIMAIAAILLITIVGATFVPTTGNKPRSASASATNAIRSNFTPLAAPPITGDTGETVFAPVYTESGQNGKRLGFIRETGMVVTEDGEPVANPEDGSVVLYDEENQTYIDAANRTLGIYLDSRLDKHYLKAGGNFLSSIDMDREVVLISLYTTGDETTTIYAFREPIKLNFWEKLGNFVTFNWNEPDRYRFLDMNNQEIDESRLISFKDTMMWTFSVLWASQSIFAERPIFPVVEILERTTLRELYTVMESATVHPWDTMKSIETGETVVTSDGKEVYINPRTNQLVDFYGWALFNEKNGLPILFYENEIITTNDALQAVNGNVLVDSMTVWNMLNSGTAFYMVVIPTKYGSFDAPAFKRTDDPNVNDFYLMDGKTLATDAGALDHRLSTVQDGETLGEWWARITSGGSGGFDLLGTLKTIGIIILCIIGLIIALKVIGFILDIFRGGGRSKTVIQFTNGYKKRRRR
jgi:hypothetical protein